MLFPTQKRPVSFWQNLKGKLLRFLQTDSEEMQSVILKALLENKIDSVMVINEQGIILTFNKAAEETFGYQSKEVLGENISLLMDPPYNEEMTTTQTVGLKKECLGRHKDGSILLIELSVTAITANKKPYFVEIIRDISQKKRGEIVWAANILIQSEMKVKTDFITTASHEFRTPLHSIMGFTECLIKGLDGPLLEAQKISLAHISDAGKHLIDLTNDMLQLAKVTPKEYDLTIEPCSLIKTLNSCINMFSFIAKQKHLEIHKDFSEDIEINANAKNLQEIFINLLSNAIKFTEKGSVTVSLTSSSEEITVSVTDTGCGISEENLPKIFIPFWTILGKTKQEHTGLGLSITKHLVELQGGKIEVLSKKNEGSTFIVHLHKAHLSEKTMQSVI